MFWAPFFLARETEALLNVVASDRNSMGRATMMAAAVFEFVVLGDCRRRLDPSFGRLVGTVIVLVASSIRCRDSAYASQLRVGSGSNKLLQSRQARTVCPSSWL